MIGGRAVQGVGPITNIAVSSQLISLMLCLCSGEIFQERCSRDESFHGDVGMSGELCDEEECTLYRSRSCSTLIQVQDSLCDVPRTRIAFSVYCVARFLSLRSTLSTCNGRGHMTTGINTFATLYSID